MFSISRREPLARVRVRVKVRVKVKVRVMAFSENWLYKDTVMFNRFPEETPHDGGAENVEIL